MIPTWLAGAVVLAFPGIVAAGYIVAHLLDPRPANAVRGLLLYIALLCVPLAAVLLHDPGCAAGLLAAPPLWILAGIASGPALWWLQTALPGETPDASGSVYTGPPGAGGFALVMLPVAFIVLAEEVIWRGFLQPRLTLLPAAAAFALHHLFFGWRHLAFSFLAGAAWGLLFWASDSLWPPAAAHVMYNALAWHAMRRSHPLHRSQPCSADPSSPPPPSP